jgi:4-hydroxy-tetrahydrodipicolinate synthase
MVTPFNADGSVNYVEARRIAAHLVDVQQNDGIVVNGTTGESPTLKEDEKLRLLEEVIDEVGDRAAILFGAGSYDTAESIHMTQEGERRGAHGIMIVSPYYSRPSQAGLFAHYSAIAGATSLPILVYNIQGRTAVNIETPTMMRLAEIPNIVAVKEASGNIPQISEVCRQKPNGFRVYSGDDGLTLPILALGGHGVVSVAAHINGKQIKELIQTFQTNPARAAELHHQMVTLISAVFSTPNPGPVKYMLATQGFDSERQRLPLIPLSEAEKALVFKALNDYQS